MIILTALAGICAFAVATLLNSARLCSNTCSLLPAWRAPTSPEPGSPFGILSAANLVEVGTLRPISILAIVLLMP
jgi:hypothetical protein